MSDYAIKITQFTFPKDLDDDEANFRLQVDVRYRKVDVGFGVHTVILPGLDRYLECDKRTQQEDNPKRGAIPARLRTSNAWQPGINLDRVDTMGKLFRLSAEELYELRVTVFDVDRRGWKDRLANIFKSMLDIAKVPIPIVGSLADEGVSFVVGKMANDDDRFVFSYCADKDGQSWNINHRGYILTFESTELPSVRTGGMTCQDAADDPGDEGRSERHPARRGMDREPDRRAGAEASEAGSETRNEVPSSAKSN